MMTAMFGGERVVAIAFVDRPSTTMLAVAAALGAIGWALHAWVAHSTAPPHPTSVGDRRPEPIDGRTEPPAVVALLTNSFEVPNTAVTATLVDLATRQWLRFSTLDDELVVVATGRGIAGDTLRPFEQQVLNHVASRAFNGIVSAGSLAISQSRLDRRWWLRFRSRVVEEARAAGWCNRRFTAVEVIPPALCCLFGLIACWVSLRNGVDEPIAESWTVLAAWVGVVGALAALGWCTAARSLDTAQSPTDAGLARAAEWMGYRRRLAARIPRGASVIAPPAQQTALANACVMGVAPHLVEQLPVVGEDHRRAWSEAGGVAHVVRVRYPIRPGYGQQPWRLAVSGVVVGFVFRWLHRFLGDVSDGEALQSLIDRAPGQVDLIHRIAEVLAALCWIPIVWAVWAIVAGVLDTVATRVRIGMVVRTRRPGEVVPFAGIIKPFADRTRFATYLAVDDGRRRTVTAWLANERTAAPQGTQARVRATVILGYVRSSEPVGTATAVRTPSMG